MEITLDERPITQRDLTIMFGERDLFLSIFNPRYFIDVLGSKGRDLLERYLPEVPKDEVMKNLSEHDQKLLNQQEFLSAEAFAKKLREEIAQLKRDMIYTQGQKDLQKTQAQDNANQLSAKQERYQRFSLEADTLETRRTTEFDGSSLTEKLAELYARHGELIREQPAGPELTAELDAQIQTAAQALEQVRAREYQSKYIEAISVIQAQIDTLGKEVSRQKHIVAGLKPGVQCPMCKQTVTEGTLPQVRNEFQTSVNDLCRQGREQMGQLGQQSVQLDQQPAELVYTDASCHIQRRQDGLPTDGEQLGQAGLAQGAQLHRALFHLGGGPLQSLCHGLRWFALCFQKGRHLATGPIGVIGDGLNLLNHLFDGLHKIFSFSLLVF